MLNQIFQDREKWKKDTFERIKKNLLSVRDKRFVQYSQTNGLHLVCLYGKSQVGKTTLILNMLGLKNDECKKNVSNVLRGGIAHGNSSTSTAIIYSQSDSNQYGLCLETLEGQQITESINCSSEEMILQLQFVRDKVEKNEFPANGILHISIPKDYFTESISREKISILDLPGVESCNIKEKLHVRGLMNRYLPLSSVCIITCPASTIQSLEKEELPNNIDWKYLSHKYIVVLTRAYSDGSIKSYFQKTKKQRTENFENFLKDRYKAEISRILGPNNNTEIFPIDIGDSFEMLLTNELKNEEDRNEARSTRDSILDALQATIIRRKGEQLLSSIKELRAIVEHSEETEIKELEKEIGSNNSELNKKREKLQRHNESLNNLKGDFQLISNDLTTLNNAKQTVDRELTNEISTFSQALITTAKKTIRNKSLVKNKGGENYLHDNNEFVLSTIWNYLNLNIRSSIVDKAQSLLQRYGISPIDFYPDEIASTIYNQFIESYKDKLYPKTGTLIGPIIDWVFDCKVTLSKAYYYIDQIQKKITSVMQSTIIYECNKKFETAISEKKTEYNKSLGKIKIEESTIGTINQGIDEIETMIAENKNEINNIINQKKVDNETLNTYLRFAKEAYMCQRNEILKRINSNISSVEKTSNLLLLGIISKDYTSLINASNG